MTALAIVAIAEALVFGAIIYVLVRIHVDVTKDLHLRLASKSLEEYHYWRDGHELEVEHNKKVLEKVREGEEEKDKTVEMTSEMTEAINRSKGF